MASALPCNADAHGEHLENTSAGRGWVGASVVFGCWVGRLFAPGSEIGSPNVCPPTRSLKNLAPPMPSCLCTSQTRQQGLLPASFPTCPPAHLPSRQPVLFYHLAHLPETPASLPKQPPGSLTCSFDFKSAPSVPLPDRTASKAATCACSRLISASLSCRAFRVVATEWGAPMQIALHGGGR